MYNQKSFNKTYIFFSIFLAIFSMENIYSEGYYLPENSRFIKTGYSIKNLCWNPNNTTFAYTEGNLVLIRNAETFELINSIEIPNIEKIMFSKEGSLNNEVLLTLTKDGKLATYNLSVSNQPSISLNYNDINTPPIAKKKK